MVLFDKNYPIDHDRLGRRIAYRHGEILLIVCGYQSTLIVDAVVVLDYCSLDSRILVVVEDAEPFAIRVRIVSVVRVIRRCDETYFVVRGWSAIVGRIRNVGREVVRYG